MSIKEIAPVTKLETGIPGLDTLTLGGIPRGRTTLVSGTSGSAKTVFAVQFLVMGIIEAGEGAVFVTFEETPDDIRKNMAGFGWDIQGWEAEGKWAFVDASPLMGVETIDIGGYDLGALLVRIEHAIHKVGAKRVSVDSIGAVFSQISDSSVVRSELFRIASVLKKIGVTTFITSERTEEYGNIARFGIEEFVSDNVIILRNVLDEEKRRRTVEILKLRGVNHQKGEFPFTVMSGQGIVMVPLSGMEMEQKTSKERITSGNAEMDRMCGGGFFRDSIILASGATGTGKTLMAAEFMYGGIRSDERSLLLAFEESRDQICRNAESWGIDFTEAERAGKLKLIPQYPEVMSLEEHLVTMKKSIDEFKPNRLAVDSLSAIERVSTVKSFREFVIALTSYLKQCEIATLFTAATPNLMGGPSITERHISTITDSIVLLRYAELFGEIHRGITVLKMRGSQHDKQIREYYIDDKGMHIGKPFHNVTGILTGSQVNIAPREMERVGDLFKEEEALSE